MDNKVVDRIVGTANFASFAFAVRYYDRQGENKAAVEEKIKEGLISIGIPDHNPLCETIHQHPVEGRYFITYYK